MPGGEGRGEEAAGEAPSTLVLRQALFSHLHLQKKSARRIFREIAQELYSKRHVGASQQPVSIK